MQRLNTIVILMRGTLLQQIIHIGFMMLRHICEMVVMFFRRILKRMKRFFIQDPPIQKITLRLLLKQIQLQ